MPKYKSSLQLITDADDERWHMVVALLEKLGVRFWRPNPHQLKIGPVSFYPHKGTVYIDGDKRALPERGLKALERYLCGGRQLLRSGADSAGSSQDIFILEIPPQPAPAIGDLIIEEPDDE